MSAKGRPGHFARTRISELWHLAGRHAHEGARKIAAETIAHFETDHPVFEDAAGMVAIRRFFDEDGLTIVEFDLRKGSAPLKRGERMAISPRMLHWT